MTNGNPENIIICHSHENGNPDFATKGSFYWIPAFAGMTFFIRLILMWFIFLGLFQSGCSFNIPQTSEEEMQKIITRVNSSRFIILDVYHNRCESCKQIEPVIEELKSGYNQNNDVIFLKYDLSNPITIFKSKQIAKALGLEHIYNLQKYSGIVLIIDSKTKQVLDTLIAEYNIEKYNEIIQKRIHDL